MDDSPTTAVIDTTGHVAGLILGEAGYCLRDPAVQAARPLDVVVKDWGHDDLLPAALKERVRQAAYL